MSVKRVCAVRGLSAKSSNNFARPSRKNRPTNRAKRAAAENTNCRRGHRRDILRYYSLSNSSRGSPINPPLSADWIPFIADNASQDSAVTARETSHRAGSGFSSGPLPRRKISAGCPRELLIIASITDQICEDPRYRKFSGPARPSD